MFIASLTDAELETLVIVLKYWRCHRHEGRGRQQDSEPADVDALVAKLATGTRASFPPDEDLLVDLISR